MQIYCSKPSSGPSDLKNDTVKTLLTPHYHHADAIGQAGGGFAAATEPAGMDTLLAATG